MGSNKSSMKTITRKSDLKAPVAECLAAYRAGGVGDCVKVLHAEILSHKVKFPLLEFVAKELHRELPSEKHLELCDRVEALKTEGGNVILGMVLQCRLREHFHQSLEKATEYISQAHIWYICDIIGERVFGVALLRDPKRTLPKIEKLSHHPANWVVRSLGAGIHYAIKKGLEKEDVAAAFRILLSKASHKDKEIRQGIGWAAKTTAKFHPDLIEQFQDEINDPKLVANWFRSKIEIGLNRHEYARRNRG